LLTIKFSHTYEKFPPSLENTFLVDVEAVNLEDLDSEFLEKDTKIVGGGHYPLPEKGKYLILWLESGVEPTYPWQTIRRWTKGKEGYYRSHIGERVICDVP